MYGAPQKEPMKINAMPVIPAIRRRMGGLINGLSHINLGLLAILYVLGYILIESLLRNSVQLYIFTVFLSLSGIYFSWFIGGKGTLRYVAFFNGLIVFIFSKLLWSENLIVTPAVFRSKSFVLMYLVSALFILLVFIIKSPADARQEAQNDLIETEKRLRQNFEFMVASRKLKQDLLAQANLVKDELQLIEGAWRSNIHDIINELPPVKERELYQQIILPFQNNIIHHLRELERKLTFDVEWVGLDRLSERIILNLEKIRGAASGRVAIEMMENAWASNNREVAVDENKVWDMVVNVVRNSQAALDLKQIHRIRAGKAAPFKPRIEIRFITDGPFAEIRVLDNGDGVSESDLVSLYKEPVVSKKRNDGKPGQGTLFVKFFADRMNIGLHVKNIELSGEKGLSVAIKIPLKRSTTPDETGGE